MHDIAPIRRARRRLMCGGNGSTPEGTHRCDPMLVANDWIAGHAAA
jgi:hypothetical protein